MRRLLLALLIAPFVALADSGPLQMRASELIGSAVFGTRGERVGEVRDVILDARDGTIRSFIIEYGGWLGIGEREVALAAARLAQRGEKLVLEGTEEALRSAPAFERPVWPAMRASALINREVRDRLHRDSGEIADLALDLSAGRVHHALINLRDDWQPGRRLVAVPIEDFSLPRDMGRYAILNVTRDHIGALR